MSERQDIIIEHLGSSTLTGRSAAFTTDHVQIGRTRDNDVVFDPTRDRFVSARHAVIRREGDRLVVEDLGSRNGTYVNGRKALSAQPVAPGDEVALGREGPSFRVRLGALDDDFGATLSLSADIGSTYHDRCGAPDKQGAHAIGMNTLMGVVGQATHRERRRLLRLASWVGAALGLFLLIVWWNFNSRVAGAAEEATDAARSTIAQATRELRGGSGSFATTIAEVKQSMYVVLLEKDLRDSRTLQGDGTAWSVAPGWLATNAHVAEPFLKLKRGEAMIARGPGSGGDLRIRAVRLHPGYAMFQELLERYKPFDLNAKGGFFSVHPACDVALLEIDPRDVPMQAKPIPLLAAADGKSVMAGAQVATLGFPMEGMSGGGTDLHAPEPKSAIFPISNVTTAFLGRAEDDAEAINFTYQFQSAGGSSGSPVFNAAGVVVGLLSAGNVVGQHRDGSRDMGGGCMYGPSVGLLQELLEDRAEQAMVDRSQRWRAWFEDRHTLAMEDPEVPARVLLYRELSSRAASAGFKLEGIDVVDEDAGEARVGGSRGRVKLSLKHPRDGWYAVCAVAERPSRIVLRTRALGGYESGASTWFECASFEASRAGEVEFEVFTDVDDGESPIRIYLARAK